MYKYGKRKSKGRKGLRKGEANKIILLFTGD